MSYRRLYFNYHRIKLKKKATKRQLFIIYFQINYKLKW